MIYEEERQLSLFDLDMLSTKMSQGHSLPTAEGTSKPSSRNSSASQSQTLPMCLCLVGGGGASQDASTMNWVSGALLGDYSMDNIGVQPYALMMENSLSEALHRGVSASQLSQILQDDAPPKYSLSARACIGILNRAEKRGKGLPEILKNALESQVTRSNCDSEG